jgi:hypothetical protein
MQMVGRGLRLWPNKKECVVLDFSDKNHTICNPSVLLGDTIIDEHLDPFKKKLLNELPKQLDPVLKYAIVNHDPLGKSFTWERSREASYFMRGGNQVYLEIQQYGREKYRVTFYDEQRFTIVADNLIFEWAFAAAEDYARANRKLFAISDKEAPWRKERISKKQKDFIKKSAFKTSGINKLTRGQAADIIQSGVLYREHQ